MVKINPISANTYITVKNTKPLAFTSNPNETTSAKAETVSNRPNLNVKVPISYQKTGETELSYGMKAHCYKLANGQRVVILPKEGSTMVKTYVSTGSLNEPDNVRGISHYIEHNLFNGSEGLDAGEFFKTVNEMGAETNASTGFAETNYYITSNLLNDEDLETKIKIHASMLETPTFAQKMLDKEKGIVNSEINMILGDPFNIAVNNTLKSLFNIKSTSIDLVGGTTDNITGITREDVVDYYNNNYYPANMVTVVTGEVDPDETMKLISKYFSGTNKVTHQRKFEELTPIQAPVRKDITSEKATSTIISMGFEGPKNNNIKEALCFDVITKLLTSDKTGRIDKALKPYNAYTGMDVEKISSRPQDSTAILINTECSEENCENVLKNIYEQIFSTTTNPISEEQLQTIKKKLINIYDGRFESSRSLNDLIGSNMLTDTFEQLPDIKNIINSLTVQDITDTAKKYLDLNKTAITIIHPTKQNSAQVSFSGNMHKQAINPDSVQRYSLNNNIDVITNISKTDNSFLNFTFNTELPPDINPAVAGVMEVMLNEGTAFKNDTEFKEDLDKFGVSTYASSGTNRITIFSKCSASDIDKSISSMMELLHYPRFTQETLDFAKQKIKNDITLSEKSSTDKLNQELFKGTPYGYTKYDILNNLDNVKLEDVLGLYNYLLTKSQAHLTVSAPFDRQPQLKDKIFTDFSALPNVQINKPFTRKLYFPTQETKVLTDVHDKNQAEIIEAFKYKDNGNARDEVVIDLLTEILGGGSSSRIFQDLREKQQLAYRVQCYSDNLGDTGVLGFFIKTTTENKETGELSYDNIKKSIEGFNKHVQLIKSEPVTQEELESAKLQLKNAYLSATETTGRKNGIIADNAENYYGPLKFNKYLEIIDSVTADDIQQMANYIFNSNPTYSVLATENSLKANKEYLNSLEK